VALGAFPPDEGKSIPPGQRDIVTFSDGREGGTTAPFVMVEGSLPDHHFDHH
jgi:hypothetical protein